MTLEVKSKIQALSYEINASKNSLDEARKTLASCESQINLLNLSSEVLKDIGDKRKRSTIEVFERVCSKALHDIFDSNYRFVIEMDSEGKRVSTRFKLMDAEDNEYSIMDSCGGGIVDVISLVLRVLILVSAKPARSKVLYLDESTKHVSPEFRPKVAEFLKSLSRQLGIQILLVTHQKEMLEASDSAYQLEKTNNGTLLRRMS